MKRKIGYKILIIFLAATLLSALALFPYASNDNSAESGISNFGTYTFEREATLPSGKTLKFYESGDSSYHYYHDNNGYILLRDGNGVYYAENSGGKPVNSGVSYDASEYVVNRVNKITADEIDFAQYPELLMDSEYKTEEVSKEPLLSGDSEFRQIINVVIYVMFNNEDSSTRALLESHPNNDVLNGNGYSLKSYYSELSYGELDVVSIVPYAKNDTTVLVYRAPEARSYYYAGSNDSSRARKERELLSGAVQTVASGFNFDGLNLDINNDGCVDSVSFLISNSSSSDWGNLLWPHKWSFDGMNAPEVTLGGYKVNEYMFNFSNALKAGVLCHEFFHVLGAPDLYHYDDNFVPVGKWDVMEKNLNVPQYTLTYMRDKYLGALPESAIGTITENGVYSLSPVTLAEKGDLLSYIIPGKNSDEYFMVEYRNPTVTQGFDAGIYGEGLVVYRINTTVKNGNRDALYQNSSRPDEVYVFRPKVGTGSNLQSSNADLEKSYLSPNNDVFKRIGATLSEKPTSLSRTRYDYETVFYSDGTNSGIIIETISISNSSIEFKVQVSEDNIQDDYFQDKIEITDAEYYNGEFSGVKATVKTSELNPAYISSLTVVLKDINDVTVSSNTLLLGAFRDAYVSGRRQFDCYFVISDKGSALNSVFKEGGFISNNAPVTAEIWLTDSDNINIEDARKISELTIKDNGYTWEGIRATETALKAGIYASSRITLGIRYDGTVTASGNTTVNQWAVQDATNIISAAAGFTHTLLLDRNLNVTALGNDFSGETNVSQWSNIKYVSAGFYTSYGVDINGRVYAAGSNSAGQLNVGGWSGISSISAGERHVAAVTLNGTVLAAGDNSMGAIDVSGFTGVTAVAAGNTFTAALTEGGRVLVAGFLQNKDSVGLWRDIVKISAGRNYLIGLKSDGTAVSAGDNAFGQSDVSGLIDITDIAAGEYHSAYLRKDGVVQYKGIGNESFNTNKELKNLIYDNYVYATGLTFSLNKLDAFVGDEILAASVVLPENASYKKVVYTSANPEIASVSEDGKVTALSSGTTIITAAVNGTDIKEARVLNVSERVDITGIDFADGFKSVKLGDTAYLMLKLFPINSTMPFTVAYESDNPAIATAATAPDGVNCIVTGVSYGKAIITAIVVSEGKTFRATAEVQVLSDIHSIEWDTLPEKVFYKYGENIDLTGAAIKVYFENGGSPVVATLTADMISGYSPVTKGSQTLTVNYIDKTLTFTVEVRDYVTSIEVAGNPVKEYLYGSSFSLSGGTIKINYVSGDTAERTFADSSIEITGYNPSLPGIQTLTVKYISISDGAFYSNYAIRLLDTVDKVESALRKTVYSYGESLDLTDTVLVTMKSGAMRLEELAETVVTGFDGRIVGEQRIEISYTCPASGVVHNIFSYVEILFDAEIIINELVRDLTDNSVSGYKMNGRESESTDGNLILEYPYGGELPLGVSCEYGFSRFNITAREADSGYAYYITEGFNNTAPTAAGEYPVTIRVFIRSTNGINGSAYQELFTFLQYVKPYSNPQSVTLECSESIRFGEAPVINIICSFETGSNEVFRITDPNYINYNPNLIGEAQTVKVRFRSSIYGGEITIIDYISGIKTDASAEIYFGETWEPNIFLDMAGGEDIKLALSDVVLTYNARLLGEQNAVVSYTASGGEEYTVNVLLTVLDRVVNIEVDSGIKQNYYFGETVDFSSSYKLKYLSGAEEVIAINTTDFRVSPFNTNILGIQNVSIVYLPLSKTFTFAMNVRNYCANINLLPGSVTEYSYGDSVKLVIEAIMANGTVMRPTDFTVTGFDSSVIGDAVITISYDRCVKEVSITVKDIIDRVYFEVVPGKRDYRFGEAINYAPGVFIVKYKSGAETRFVGNEIAELSSSYDPKKSGYQEVVVSFGGLSASFRVRVESESLATFTLGEGAWTLSGSKIIADDSVTVGELFSKAVAASYLSVVIYDANGAVVTEDTESFMQTGGSLAVVNRSGQNIYYYKYYLKGDASGDGIFDSDDLSSLLKDFLTDTADKEVADYDGDGVFTLKDLVNWARRSAGPDNTPINDYMKNMVTNVKLKEEDGV